MAETTCGPATGGWLAPIRLYTPLRRLYFVFFIAVYVLVVNPFNRRRLSPQR